MKANEVPEKVYIEPSLDSIWGMAERSCKSEIEYTRTDIFIEKAVQYLKVHKEEVETEDNGIIGWIPDYFIEDFKNYMKGE